MDVIRMYRTKNGRNLGVIFGMVQVCIAAGLFYTESSFQKLYINIFLVYLLVGPIVFGMIIDVFRRNADVDPLTKAYNRRLLPERFNRVIKQAKKNHLNCGVFLIDIDGFKMINDSYGHAFGDRVLIEISRMLRAKVGKQGFVSRIGGDEFLVVTSLHSEQSALQLQVEFIQGVQGISNLLKNPVGISVGYGMYGTHGVKLFQLIEHADRNMYDCKNEKVSIPNIKHHA